MVSKRDTYLLIAILAWVICAGVAYIFALRTIDASFVDGRFFPVYGGSFYHASRILDVFQGSMENFHFDSNAYAPEGTWVTWPWLYDKTMAALVHVAFLVTGNDEQEYLLFNRIAKISGACP